MYGTEYYVMIGIVVLGFLAVIAFAIYRLIANHKEKVREKEEQATLTPEERREREKRVQDFVKGQATVQARNATRRNIDPY